jgi:hypothetical protein
VPEQADHFGNPQLPFRRPLDQREERPQLLLRRDQGGEAGAQQAGILPMAMLASPRNGLASLLTRAPPRPSFRG